MFLNNVWLLLAAKLLLPVAIAVYVNAPPIVPGAYVAEFADDTDVNEFYSELGTNAVPVNRRLGLKYSLFNGASFQLQDTTNEAATVDRIAQLASVKRLWPVRVYSVPKDTVHWTGNDSPLSNQQFQKRQSSNVSDTFSTHVMTQVDKLRAKGVVGKGIKIAVIDTGVDYTHPALGGGFGEGHLVSYGTDLVGDDYTGYNTPVPDADPYDGCEGHGTHVSGIIAAQDNPYGFTGAAPGVTLGAYRVFGCEGSAGNDVLIAAYLQAYEDGSQIITASIGGPSGWSEDPWAVAVSRIVDAGVPCTVSAGNDGPYGLFYASTAANGKKVTAVASYDNSEAAMVLLNATYTTDNSSDIPFGWAQGSPANWGNLSLPLWALSYNTSDPANGCTAFPEDTPDLSGYIILVRRGTCTFVQKATNAAAKGAHYIMFYNNIAGANAVTTNVEGIYGAGMVTAAQGAQWISLLQSGSEVLLDIVDPAYATQYRDSEPNINTGGYLSTYTSWGPTYEVEVKPQYGAPGGIILSTYPQTLGSYAVLSGTSMSCPLVAAITALIAEVRGTFDPATIENTLSANAKPNVFQDGRTASDLLAPVAQQGGGLVQAYDAAYATTLLSVSSISFNDTDHFVEQANFTIYNTGSEDVTYSLSNVGAATGYTLAAGTIYPDTFPNELTAAYADIAFSESKVTLSAGDSVSISISPTPPTGLDASRLAVYSGYITLNATNGENLSLPYIGVVGSMYNATILDVAYLSTSADAELNPVPANTTFVLPSPGANSTANVTYPEAVISLALGSAVVRVDVIPAEGSYDNATEVLGVKTLGNVYGYPYYYNPRAVFTADFTGQLEDGSYAPAGTYTLLVRTLHIFGDPTKAADYDVAETVPFSIRYV